MLDSLFFALNNSILGSFFLFFNSNVGIIEIILKFLSIYHNCKVPVFTHAHVHFHDNNVSSGRISRTNLKLQNHLTNRKVGTQTMDQIQP